MRRPFLLGLLSIAIAAPVWLPLLDPHLDFWRPIDAENHLLRLYAVDHLLAQGLVFPRWLPDLFHGFGQPLTNFYAPLVYLLGSWTHQLTGISLYGSFQLLAAAEVWLGAAGVAVLVSRLTSGLAPALFASAFFVYSPFPFLLTLYHRGDLPEALALGLLPWCAMGLLEASRAHRGRWAWAALGAAAGAAGVLAHNMMGPIGLAIALAIGVAGAAARVPSPRCSGQDREPTHHQHDRRYYASLLRRLRCPALALLASAGLSAFFWLPVAAEQSYVKLGEALVADHGSYRDWLIDPLGATTATLRPEYIYTASGPLDLHLAYRYASWFPLKLSWAQILPLALLLAVWLVRAVRRPERLALLKTPAAWLVPATAGAIAAGAWFFTTTWSEFLWDRLYVLRAMQHSYRLYGPIGFGLAVVAGYLAAAVRVRGLGGVALLSGLGVLMAANALLAHDKPINPSVDRSITSARLRSIDRLPAYMETTARQEFMPRTVQVTVFNPPDVRTTLFDTLYPETNWIAGIVMPFAGTAAVHRLDAGGLEYRATVEAGGGGATLAIHQLDFPGWTAYVDGRRVTHGHMPYREDVQATLGFMLIDVPAGVHDVVVSFESTPPRLAGTVLSGATLCLLLIGGAGASWRTVRRRVGGRFRARLGGATTVALAWGAIVCGVSTAGWLVDQVNRTRAPGPPHVPLHPALVRDLAADALAGNADVLSPSGPALGRDRFVDVRWLRLGVAAVGGARGDFERRWLFLHPPSRVTYRLDVPRDAQFQAGLALDPGAWAQDAGDGVRFIVEAQQVGATRTTPTVLLDRQINPRARGEERGWNDVAADLSAFAGTQIALTLRTEPGDSSLYDWSGWGNPVIVTRTSARWK